MDVKDALVLEKYEQTRFRNKRTRAAIRDTYGRKSPTKKRRKLPGKRKWKNKSKMYASLEGKMTATEFNQKNAAMEVLDKVYKKKQKEKHGKRQRHSLTE